LSRFLIDLQRAWELGFNTFDTSNFYCNGVSEEILGKFLKTVPREAVVIMTKVVYETNRAQCLVTHEGYSHISQSGTPRLRVQQG
jgi:aryl-alcohol dehydrogenase-like predicted oxidoreductase